MQITFEIDVFMTQKHREKQDKAIFYTGEIKPTNARLSVKAQKRITARASESRPRPPRHHSEFPILKRTAVRRAPAHPRGLPLFQPRAPLRSHGEGPGVKNRGRQVAERVISPPLARFATSYSKEEGQKACSFPEVAAVSASLAPSCSILLSSFFFSFSPISFPSFPNLRQPRPVLSNRASSMEDSDMDNMGSLRPQTFLFGNRWGSFSAVSPPRPLPLQGRQGCSPPLGLRTWPGFWWGFGPGRKRHAGSGEMLHILGLDPPPPP